MALMKKGAGTERDTTARWRIRFAVAWYDVSVGRLTLWLPYIDIVATYS
jgi:hypothetical protein